MTQSHDKAADATAAFHGAVQQQQDRHDSVTPSVPVDDSRPVQTGAWDYPGLPLPSQQLDKPGMEADMTLKPQFMAPNYRGSGKLGGMVAIITGGDSGIGRAVAVLYEREGADVAIIYLNEHQDASDTQRHVEAEGQTCLRIAGDVRDADFCQRAVEPVYAQFGHIDILVNIAAFQEHADSLLDITEERFDLTMKTSVYGYFHMAKAVLRSSIPARSPASWAIKTCWITRLPKGLSTPSSWRWRPTCCLKAFASTPSHLARSGHHSILPIRQLKTSPDLATPPTFTAPPSPKSCRLHIYF